MRVVKRSKASGRVEAGMLEKCCMVKSCGTLNFRVKKVVRFCPCGCVVEEWVQGVVEFGFERELAMVSLKPESNEVVVIIILW